MHLLVKNFLTDLLNTRIFVSSDAHVFLTCAHIIKKSWNFTQNNVFFLDILFTIKDIGVLIWLRDASTYHATSFSMSTTFLLSHICRNPSTLPTVDSLSFVVTLAPSTSSHPSTPMSPHVPRKSPI